MIPDRLSNAEWLERPAVQTIFSVLEGAAGRTRTVGGVVRDSLIGRMRAPADESLSAREIEVLGLVARGASNKEIARSLHISEATVKSHLVHIFAKLDVDSRTAAVATAVRRGLIRHIGL